MNKVSENLRGTLPDDLEIAAHARAIFRTACEGTDSYHALRLGHARRKALAAGARRRGAALWITPLAGGAVACCALAVGIVALRPASPPPATMAATTPAARPATPPERAAASDAGDDASDIASNQMDMVQNLDFYRWLATQPSVASVSGAGGN